MDRDCNSDSDSDAGGVRRDGASGERDPLDRRETLLCDRLQKLMKAMEMLVGSRLEYRSIEKLVSCASRIFRAITKVGMQSAIPPCPPVYFSLRCSR